MISFFFNKNLGIISAEKKVFFRRKNKMSFLLVGSGSSMVFPHSPPLLEEGRQKEKASEGLNKPIALQSEGFDMSLAKVASGAGRTTMCETLRTEAVAREFLFCNSPSKRELSIREKLIEVAQQSLGLEKKMLGQFPNKFNERFGLRANSFFITKLREMFSITNNIYDKILSNWAIQTNHLGSLVDKEAVDRQEIEETIKSFHAFLKEQQEEIEKTLEWYENWIKAVSQTVNQLEDAEESKEREKQERIIDSKNGLKYKTAGRSDGALELSNTFKALEKDLHREQNRERFPKSIVIECRILASRLEIKTSKELQALKKMYTSIVGRFQEEESTFRNLLRDIAGFMNQIEKIQQLPERDGDGERVFWLVPKADSPSWIPTTKSEHAGGDEGVFSFFEEESDL